MTPPSSPSLSITNKQDNNDSSVLTHRIPDITSSAGEYNLGRIQLTLRYSVQRQNLLLLFIKL